MAKKDTCPICGKPAIAAQAPFCSRGCRDRDLLQWLGEGYRIPAGPADPEDPSAPTPGLDSANDAD
ncbi:MAG: DNA gyrase inhibitor YacG [Pseudomonadota bacterium]